MDRKKKADSAGEKGSKHEVTPKTEKSQNTPKKGHSSEHKKQNDSLMEALREWENKYKAVLKEKETATYERNELREKVEHLEAEAKKQRTSLSPEQEKTNNSLDKAKTEWENKCKAAEKEKDAACKELEKTRMRVEQLEKEAKKLRLSPEQAKTINSLDKAKIEWENKCKAAEKEKNAACKELEKIRMRVVELEKRAFNLSEEPQQTVKRNQSDISKLKDEITSLTEERDNLNKNLKDMKETLRTSSKDSGLKERNEKLSTELTDIKRKDNELEKENLRLQKKYDELMKEKMRLQTSQGNHDIGSDVLTTGVADVCAFCASKGKLNPALYNCKGCTEFGRYICGCCKENHDLFTQHTAARISTK